MICMYSTYVVHIYKAIYIYEYLRIRPEKHDYTRDIRCKGYGSESGRYSSIVHAMCTLLTLDGNYFVNMITQKILDIKGYRLQEVPILGLRCVQTKGYFCKQSHF